MLTIAALLFAVAAVGGITLATLHLRHKGLPMPLALGHGLLAAAGLVVLFVAVVGGSAGGMVKVSLVLFVIVALVGFALFSFYLRRQPLWTAQCVVGQLCAIRGLRG